MVSRIKKEFPPGTFIPTYSRVLAIIQLCIAFTMILWHLSQPFLGDIFRVKSHLLVYNDLMGIMPAAAPDQAKKERLQRNGERFQNLPEEEKTRILNERKQIQSLLHQPFLQKTERAFVGLLRLPPLEQAWLFLSLIIPILLLKRTEGARAAVWLLPLLVLCYGIDNRWHALIIEPSQEARLFPTEKTIVENYLKEPLSSDLATQQEQLKKGWKTYLIKEWTLFSPSTDPQLSNLQAEEGEFFFNIERVKTLQANHSIPTRYYQESLIALAFYLFWNIFFALAAQKQE